MKMRGVSLSGQARFWVGLCAAFGLLAGPLHAQPEYPIQRDAVVAAVLAAHPELSGDSLKMAMRVEAREPAPQFVVGPVQELSQQAAQKAEQPRTRLGRIRVQCATASDCLPFVTWVQLPAEFIAESSQRDTARAGSLSTVSAKGAPRIQMAGAGRAGNSDGVEVPVLRHGERVRLILDSGLLHVSFPAICMQDAAMGASVRVRAAKGEREYLGVVIDAATVRGAL